MATAVAPSTARNGDPANDGSSHARNQDGKATLPDEKKEDDKRSTPPSASVSSLAHHGGLATPKKASSPEGSVLPVNMPASMMTPNNRPPSRSSISVQSAGSAGGRTTTSVSRRGGRTRSRSPTGHIHSYGARPPSTTPSVPSEVVPQSPRNPSAAAAAAAAAAKSFRNTGASSGSHLPMHYQQQAPYGGPPNMRGPPPPGSDMYGRQPGARQDPYSRYPPGQPHSQRPPSSASTSYPGGPPPSSQSQQRPPSSLSSSYPGGPPPPGYYDPHNGSRNPSSSHHYYQSGRGGPPPPGRGYESQPPSVGPDGRPLSRNGDPQSQQPYGYNPYHRNAPSRGGPPPPGSGRDYGGSSSSSSRYASSSSGPGGGPPGSGPVESGEYGRQHHGNSSNRHLHPHYHSSGGQPPPGHSSRNSRTPYSGSSHGHHPSYRHGDPNYRGALSTHYRGGPPPSSRGPPPGHPDYPRYHSSQYQQQGPKGQGDITKSTRTVIGTATPLHLNKGGQGPMPQASNKPPSAPQHPGNQLNNMTSHTNNKNNSNTHDSRRGSAASVFRGRPGPPSGGSHNPNNNAPSTNNPKSILDSLDTPSNSFEEKKCSRDDGKDQHLLSGVVKDQQQLSPDNPPKIRNNNNASNGDGINFDPQPSPKSQTGGAMSPPQLTNSLDMAPSFSLFNQSFDSLGDTAQFFNVGGALDSTMLNSSTSFELKPSGSRSPIQTASSSTDNYLQLSASNGTFKLNASMSGALFGMSPSNSFGNGPTASFSTNPPKMTQVLGGNSDHGRSSPSQVLDMYQQSKSSNGGEEADLRLSASLGSPMIGQVGSYSSSRPFATGVEAGPPQPSLGGRNSSSSDGRNHLSPKPQRHHYPSSSSSQHQGYRHQRSPSGPPSKDGTPRFYNFLRKNKDAFLDMTFLLPNLKPVVMESKATKEGKIKDERNGVILSNDNTPKRGQSRNNSRYDREPTPAESEIARRRIVSAVCAFGGSFTGSRANPPPPSPTTSGTPDKTKSHSGLNNNKKSSKTNSQSIFREKNGEPKTVTPNSSSSSSAAAENGNRVSREQSRYDGALPTRYYESDNRLSWEFEENPPIGTIKDDPGAINYCRETSHENDEEDGTPKKKRRMGHEGEQDTADDSDDEEAKEGETGDASKKTKDGKGDSPKMRYRCKLCGQPKTNHVCPYQQSLVRNIGIMVHPAVNAFAAAEPGKLAPALSEMNNLAISAARVQAENGVLGSTDISPSRPTPDRSSVRGSNSQIEVDAVSSAAQVTPENLRSGNSSRGPDDLTTPQRSRTGTPGSSVSNNRRGGRSGTPSSTLHSLPSSSRKKRSHAKMSGSAGDQTDLLFVEEMELQSAQFRTVTPSKAIAENPDAFTYPALPLPYAQRKRLSDNLFSLSKEIPQLTDECASVLREARERDLWDLAVAELMTQVVVVVHCNEGDYCFEGLRRYLLTLGFTC